MSNIPKTVTDTTMRSMQQFTTLLFFYLFNVAIKLWHRKFVTADVTAVFVNN